MIKLPKLYESINTVVSQAIDSGVIHLTATNQGFNGRVIEIDNSPKVNFISNGYVGYECDSRVIKAANEANEKFGIHTSVSRAYVRFEEQLVLERKLEKILGLPVITCLNTTLGHFAVLPTFINGNDAVIVDQFVHTSVQMTAQYLKGANIYVETLKHNQTEILEKRIKSLSEKYENIWYLCDSVYSMHGDVAPMKDLEVLLNGYHNFYCYVDDAHGISWTGENGKGYALSKIPYNEKLFLITSLNKGFGAFSSALVFPNEEMKKIVNVTGMSLIFSTPPTHSAIAAASLIADFHLTDEIYERQELLKNKILFFLQKAKNLNLPIANESHTPIFYIYAGEIETAFSLAKFILENGFIVSVSTFPSVPLGQSGVRVSLTYYQTIDDINNLLECISIKFKYLEMTGKLDVLKLQKIHKIRENTLI